MAAAALVLALALTACGDGEPAGSAPPRDPEADERVDRRIEALRAELRRLERSGRDAAAEGEREASLTAGVEALERESGGEVGVAVGGPAPAPPAPAGSIRGGVAWSTIKLPIALAVLAEAGGPEGLDSGRAEAITAALTRSDNDAAAKLFDGLARSNGGLQGAAAAVEEVLRAAGDDRTRVSTRGRDGFSPYGQTEWSLRAQHGFGSALAAGCLVDPASSRLVLEGMGEVTVEPWGLGSLGDGGPVRRKGGWGPGPDGRYLVRQLGVLEFGDRLAIVAIAARASDGSFESSTALATRLAKLAEAEARRVAAEPPPC